MKVGKLISAIKLGRPLNALMVFAGALIGGLLAGVPPVDTIVPALSAALISMGAQAVNDYFDAEIDRKNGKKRPIASGEISRGEAVWVWMFYFALGIALSALASPIHLFAATAASLLSYAYSAFLQRKKYIGNVVVSFLVAFSLVYGALSGDVGRVLVPAFIVFLVNWGREVFKDVEDHSTDFPAKLSLAHVLNPEWASLFAGYLVFLGVILSPFPYLFGYVGYLYVPLILAASLVALYGVAKGIKGDATAAQRLVKVSMVVALAAFAAGVIG